MAQYRAIKTFRSTQFGPPPTFIVRTGVVLTMTDKDAAKLNRQTKMVELYGGPREAPFNTALPGAPRANEDDRSDDQGGEQMRDDGPTLEEFVAAGYLAENYPPAGYAEKSSPGLNEYRKQQAAARGEAGADEGNESPSPNAETRSTPTSASRQVGGRVGRLSAALQGRASRKKT